MKCSQFLLLIDFQTFVMEELLFCLQVVLETLKTFQISATKVMFKCTVLHLKQDLLVPPFPWFGFFVFILVISPVSSSNSQQDI